MDEPLEPNELDLEESFDNTKAEIIADQVSNYEEQGVRLKKDAFILTEGSDEDETLIMTWFDEAKAIKSLEEFSSFAEHILGDYKHTYSTICQGISAVTLAATHLSHYSEQGQITVFQM